MFEVTTELTSALDKDANRTLVHPAEISLFLTTIYVTQVVGPKRATGLLHKCTRRPVADLDTNYTESGDVSGFRSDLHRWHSMVEG